MLQDIDLCRHKFLVSLFFLYRGRYPAASEVSQIYSSGDLSKQIDEISSRGLRRETQLTVSDYSSLSFIDRLLEMVRFNVLRELNSNGSFHRFSTAGMNALASVYRGDNKIDFDDISPAEIVHILYYKYLKRVADDSAIKRWVDEFGKQDIISKLPLALLPSKEYSVSGRVSEFHNEIKPCNEKVSIYVDVTNTVLTGARTGIQRVVRRLAEELQAGDLTYIYFDGKKFSGIGMKEGEFLIDEEASSICFHENDVYVDLDASWGDRLDRMHLYKKLKKSGVRILNMHYDAVPILHPNSSHPTTVLRYIEHFISMMIYSDSVVCISNAVKNDLCRIAQQVGSRIPPVMVIDMGADVVKESNSAIFVPLSLSRRKYVLMVGTIEPRKNYRLILKHVEFLSSLGLTLVIVGKKGWESEDFISELESAVSAGAILWLNNVDDGALISLYKNCFIYLTTSHYEGYGLPVIEALQHGCVVVSSNGGALPEAGKGVSLIFSNESELCSLIEQCVRDPDFYEKIKSKSLKVSVATWRDSALQLSSIFNKFINPFGFSRDAKFQLVVISTRPDAFFRLVKSVHKICNISDCVVLTKGEYVDVFHQMKPELPTKCTIFADEEVLPEGCIKSTDHQERNYALRKYLLRRPEINDLILMADDDYIAHDEVPNGYFIDNGKIKGGYCFNSLDEWPASPFGATSFDKGRWNESELLNIYGRSNYVFDSHRPQAIFKHHFNEITSEYEFINGIGEWSVYFNVSLDRYPNMYTAIPSTALHWPQVFSAWLPPFFANEVYFENWYPDMQGVDLPFRERVALWKGEFEKYRKQITLRDNSCLSLGFDLDVMELYGEPKLVGLPCIWGRIPCRGQSVVSLGYRIHNHTGALVVDGLLDKQMVSYRTGIMIKNPEEAGFFIVTLHNFINHRVLGQFGLQIQEF